MQLSKFSDYSLRVLMYVGLRGEQASPVREIAGAFDVSTHHLTKVAHKLVELGLLQARRGRGGGLVLAVPAEQIVVGEVVRATENLDLVECMADGGACVLAGGCRLQRALARARDAFLAELDLVGLDELLAPRRALRSRLQL
ncbi:MAG: RrF2 family transcriptional regulator [Planctomycetota bacterium]